MKRNSQSGTSLIEVLITVVIIGATFAVLLSALGVSIYSSATHRKQATREASIRTAAELAQGTTYLKCTNTAGYQTAITSVTIVVTPLRRDGTAFAGCTAATDEGLQKLTLSVPTPAESLEIIKRTP